MHLSYHLAVAHWGPGRACTCAGDPTIGHCKYICPRQEYYQRLNLQMIANVEASEYVKTCSLDKHFWPGRPQRRSTTVTVAVTLPIDFAFSGYLW